VGCSLIFYLGPFINVTCFLILPCANAGNFLHAPFRSKLANLSSNDNGTYSRFIRGHLSFLFRLFPPNFSYTEGPFIISIIPIMIENEPSIKLMRLMDAFPEILSRFLKLPLLKKSPLT
jgi:hypothetical protein